MQKTRRSWTCLTLKYCKLAQGSGEIRIKCSALRFLQCFSSSGEFGSPLASLTTVRGEFVLKGEKAADMAALVEEHLEELRGRSVYALAQQDSGKKGAARPAVHTHGRHEQLPSWLSVVLQKIPPSWSVNEATCCWWPGSTTGRLAGT